ncbi:MAG: DUF2489 domain-containing protein [Vibrionaceae bacterium]
MSFLFFSLAALILFALAAYAGWLLSALQLQKSQQALAQKTAIAQRNAQLNEHIALIAKAALDGNCEYCEACIRIYMLMNAREEEQPLTIELEYPALYEIYELVKDMPRSDHKAPLSNKERAQFSKIREQAAQRLQDQLRPEMEQILSNATAHTSRADAM